MKKLGQRKNDNILIYRAVTDADLYRSVFAYSIRDRTKYNVYKIITLFSLFLISFFAQAQPAPPLLHVNTEGSQVSLHWSAVPNAINYRLFYAPYPYQGEESIASIDLTETTFSVGLWQDAAYYVAVKALDIQNQSSEYSNIGFVLIQDRGKSYRQFWQSTIAEISNNTFVSDDFLYQQLPQPKSCFEGTLSDLAKQRQTETLNQIRQLHYLSPVIYDEQADGEVQKTSLLHRANNSLTHYPAKSSKCFSQSASIGSKSSNLNLAVENLDPAKDVISLVDDAFNISKVAAAGHRRHLLSPFLQSTSYGQVFGATAVKVLGFSDNTSPITQESPEFVAFPYQRYPYILFSDKISTKKTPWTLSIIEDKESLYGNSHPFFTNAKITVTQKDNHQKMKVRNQHTDLKGMGVPNNLSWNVDDWQYDTWYTVSVENINYQSGETGSLKYDVYIDYKNLTNLDFPLETGDYKKSNRLIYGSLRDKKDKDSFTLQLNGKTTIKGSSQYSNMGFFISLYDANKKLIKSIDSAFTLNLADSSYTLVVSNCNQYLCYKEQKSYTVQIEQGNSQ